VLINAGIVIGSFVSGFVALTLPVEDKNDLESYEALKIDENWRLVYGFSAISEVVSLIFLLCSIKHISLLDLVKTDQKEEGIKLIKKIYKFSDETCTAEEWMEHLKSQI